MSAIVSVTNLNKTYDSGHVALRDVSLDIKEGEILALLGPNGAGKTTLISVICGLVNATSGSVTVGGFDNVSQYRQARSLIGLVPQEINLGIFDQVVNTVNFSRGLFGKKPDPGYVNKLIDELSLGDKKRDQIRELSGGMKRRVLIAKALSHQPRILFLDEPTAGVDVALRRDMWRLVEKLRKSGVTIILTTHYIEEAEAIADRVGVINKGSIIVVDEKHNLMEQLGQQALTIELKKPAKHMPRKLAKFKPTLTEDGSRLVYMYSKRNDADSVGDFLAALHETKLQIADVSSKQSSLEEIFVDLVSKQG